MEYISNTLHIVIILLPSIVIVYKLMKKGFLNFLQIFTTITPTDRELTVAIEGMKMWLEIERKEEVIEEFI